MKLDRTEIVVLAVFVLAIVTVNSYERGKALARRTHERMERERAAHDAGADVAHE
ncbi:MAG TPA: hypothetical protein VGH28_32590 [Polyangiaceae bacterium]